MDEYISREKAIETIQYRVCRAHGNKELICKRGSCAYCGIMEIMSDIESIKAADVQPVKQWISVNDRLPEIGRNVLIYYPKWDGDEIQVAKLDCDGITFDICGEFNIGTGVITHWMPLPEPPKDGEEE